MKTRIQGEQERSTRPIRPSPRTRHLSPEKEKRRMSEKRGREDTEDMEEEEPQRRLRKTQENIEVIEDETFMETSSQLQVTRMSKH